MTLRAKKTGENTATIGRWHAIRPAGSDGWVVHCNELAEWAPQAFYTLAEAVLWVESRETRNVS